MNGKLVVRRNSDELDYLVCGSCQQEFPLARFPLFVQHKKFDCDVNGTLTSLRCCSCPETFYTPWKLLSHAQQAHNLQIYFMKRQLEEEQDHDTDDDPETQGKENIKPDGEGSHVKTPVKPSSNQAHDEEVREEYNEEVKGEGVDDRGARDKVGWNEDEDLGDAVENVEMRDEGDEPVAERCCGNQDCGIMVMPGTHEKPKKCCSAVVPKKRKQHMATKHKPNSKSTRKTSHHSAKPDNSASTIYIDLGPTSEEDLHVPVSLNRQDGNPVSPGSPVSRTELHLTEDLSCPDSLPHSSKSTVIMQPGSTLSIPLYSTSQPGMPLIYTMTGEPMLKQQSDRQGSKPEETDTASKTSTSIPDALTSPDMQLNSQTSQVIDILEASQTVPQMQHQPTVVLTEPNMKGEGLSSRQQTVPSSADTYHSAMQMFNSRNTRKKRKYPTSRPFKCDMCDHSFNQRIHLKKHLSKHTGIKPFKCEQCDYSTVERSHLKVHIRVHTGEKPFKCTFCEYATAQNSTLKIHLKRHHNNAGMGVKCGMCQKSFVQQEELSQHLQSHTEGGNMTAFLLQKTPGSPDKQLGQVSDWALLQPGMPETSLSAMMSSLQTTETHETEPKRHPVTSQALSLPTSGTGRDFLAATQVVTANPVFSVRN